MVQANSSVNQVGCNQIAKLMLEIARYPKAQLARSVQIPTTLVSRKLNVSEDKKIHKHKTLNMPTMLHYLHKTPAIRGSIITLLNEAPYKVIHL